MKTKKNGYWNIKENCHRAALECKTRSEFAVKYSQAYTNTLKYNWSDEFFKHMSGRKIWNKEKCLEVATKCKSKSEFAKKYAGAYKAARKNNWLHEVCGHMKPIGNVYNKMIYVWLFPDEHFYVGQTCNSEQRKKAHLEDIRSAVNKHIQLTGLIPEEIKISDYIPVLNAVKLERETEKNYISSGFTSLNVVEPGSVGGGIRKWTKEKCCEIALTFQNRRAFEKAYGGAYKSAKKGGFLDEICSHMILRKKPNGYYTKDICHNLALKCKSRREFGKTFSTAYNVAWKNKWLDEISSHMISKRNKVTN